MSLKDGAKTGALAFAFYIVADTAMAGTLSAVGLHGYIVDAGVSLRDAWDIPQVDWLNLWETGEVELLDLSTDPCLSTGGHYHADGSCHVPVAAASLSAESLSSALQAPAVTFGN